MKKIAICLGNSNYTIKGKLENAKYDAEGMHSKLQELGFVSTLYLDLKIDNIGQITDDIRKLDHDEHDVFLMYYAGHGCQIDGDNYLLPIDFNPNDGIGLQKRAGYSLNSIVEELSKYKNIIKIIILDACRVDEHIRGNLYSGFAPIYAPENTIIAFSTSPGRGASERDKLGHGCYTSVLLDNILLPYITIENMLKKVRKETIVLTNGEQVPWEHTSLVDDFYFNRNSFYDKYTYSMYALADVNYKMLTLNARIENIIEILRTHNFYSQIPAFEIINKLDYKIEYSIDELFVLGRNIYQSACGNLWVAQNFIRSFKTYYPSLEIKIHILNGMAYEMYFDHNNKVRDYYKNDLLEEIMFLIESQDYIEASNFISYHIENDTNRLLYLPGLKQTIKVRVQTYFVEEPSMNYYVVDKIIYDRVIISDYEKASDMNILLKKDFANYLSSIFMCPRASLFIEYDNDNITDEDRLQFEYLKYFER